MQFIKRRGHIVNVHMSETEKKRIDDYARSIAQERMHQFLNGFEARLSGERMYGAQLMLDLMLITLNRTHGYAEKRNAVVLSELESVVEEYCTSIAQSRRDDPNFEYEKGVIDRVLKRIMGSGFEPWEKRYEKSIRIEEEWIAALAEELGGDDNAVQPR